MQADEDLMYTLIPYFMGFHWNQISQIIGTRMSISALPSNSALSNVKGSSQPVCSQKAQQAKCHDKQWITLEEWDVTAAAQRGRTL